MRSQIEKLKRGHSTKSERIFMEELKSHHVPFSAKVRVLDMEVDFLIEANGNKYVVEINGHEQSEERNGKFIAAGYVPIHISNAEVKNNRHLLITKFT